MSNNLEITNNTGDQIDETEEFVKQHYGTVTYLEYFCRILPKIELHAHLNGSISKNSVCELLKQKGNTSLKMPHFSKETFNLETCFEMFKFMHQLSNSEKNLRFIVKMVIQEFFEDGCTYLELRTTPRQLNNLTKAEYVELILEEIKLNPHDIFVSLLLSLDRRHTAEEAFEIVDLAIKASNRSFNTGVVVGIDVCGDPYAGDFEIIKPAILKAKALGLQSTIHLGEIDGREFEINSMLETFPNRIGHGTFIPKNCLSEVYSKKIPVEVCLTSNVLCKTVKSIKDHHIKEYFFLEKHPCTDDKGIFFSDLSNEYVQLVLNFKLTKQEVFDLSKNAMKHTFLDSNIEDQLQVKNRIFDKFEKFRDQFNLI
ncbi:hypothetical protein HK099_006088 [Clydaea vesicula]|uniref:Adenosine deaminase domain-containing protein n=1 Tax=Clydaea vesicula TaxID=447962 RepID=A0AAD5U1M9_9FUNG|nr:hypothetical protein HK099_006088 [Clydaea vesicula]